MTVAEIKRTLLTEHDRNGFFPEDVVKGIVKAERRYNVSELDVVCCMLELVYMGKNKER